MASPVVVVRPYAVAPSAGFDLEERWTKLATYLSGREGFVRCELLQCMDSESPAPYVGILEWESLRLLQEAVEGPEFARLRIFEGGKPQFYEPVKF